MLLGFSRLVILFFVCYLYIYIHAGLYRLCARVIHLEGTKLAELIQIYFFLRRCLPRFRRDQLKLKRLSRLRSGFQGCLILSGGARQFAVSPRRDVHIFVDGRGLAPAVQHLSRHLQPAAEF